MAITAKGRLYVWGKGEDGLLGLGDVADRLRPTYLDVAGFRLRSVSGGYYHTAAITSQGHVFTWGWGEYGQLGHGDTHSCHRPKRLAFFATAVRQVACGGFHTIAVCSEGHIYTWGGGEHGQLGHGDNHSRAFPRPLEYSHFYPETQENPSSSSSSSCSSQDPASPSSRRLKDRENLFFGKVFHIAGGWWHTAALISPVASSPPLDLADFHINLPEPVPLPEDLIPSASDTPPHAAPSSPAIEAIVYTSTVPQRNPTPSLSEGGQPKLRHRSASFTPVLDSLDHGPQSHLPKSEVRVKHHHTEGGMSRNKSLPLLAALESPPTLIAIPSPPVQAASSSALLPDTPPVPEPPASASSYTPQKPPVQPARPMLTPLTSWISKLFSPAAPITASASVPNISPAKSHDRSPKVLRLERMWLTELLPNLPTLRTDPETKQLCLQGIPPNIRGKVWPALIGNKLGITPAIFQQYQALALAARRSQALLDETATTQSKYQVIDGDLPRTFTAWKLFHQEGPFYRELQQILETYDIYQPSPGYVQGMSYLAATLLVHMDQYTAFVCFANLMDASFFQDLFRMDIPKILNHLHIYELLFSKHLPGLYGEIVTKYEISAEIYLLDWFLTAFTKTLPFHIATRVWDGFLLEGEIFLFRTALGILKVSRAKLKNASFERSVSTLRNLPRDVHEEELFKAIATITIPIYVVPLLQTLTADPVTVEPRDEI